MKENAVIETILQHKSIRKYKEKSPTDEEIHTIVKVGQQAPFASQLYSILLSREAEKHPYDAPLLFTICIDVHKLECMMEQRNWERITNDLTLLMFGIQDAAYMAQNMVTAAESLGLGTCFLGSAMNEATEIAKEYDLPPLVFPLVQLVMGYPAEDPPTRPRYPMDFVLFENSYPELSEDQIRKAMRQMDEGYLDQEYYRKLDAKIPLKGDKEDSYTYGEYSWTEHISRKWGQWFSSLTPLVEQLKQRGFHICPQDEDS